MALKDPHGAAPCFWEWREQCSALSHLTPCLSVGQEGQGFSSKVEIFSVLLLPVLRWLITGVLIQLSFE